MGGLGSRASEGAEPTETPSVLQETKSTVTTGKVLLLGAGGSGKSTFVRNLTVMHSAMQGTRSVSETRERLQRQHQRMVVNHAWNVFSAIIEELDLKPGSESDKLRLELSKVDFHQASDAIRAANMPHLLSLVGHSGFNDAFQRAKSDAGKASLMINAEHFIRRASIILNVDYFFPSATDIIFSLQRSTGFIQSTFETRLENGEMFDVQTTDVGGQRSERRKWIHVFDSVTLVLFFMDVTDYVRAATLNEDDSVDRWDEAMQLMQEVINSRYFGKCPFRIVLSKSDWLFDNFGMDEKVAVTPLSVDVPDEDDDDAKDHPDESPEKLRQKEIQREARAKRLAESMTEDGKRLMTTQEVLAYLRTQLPKYGDSDERRAQITVDTVQCASNKLDLLYQLYTLHSQPEGEEDPIHGLIEKEKERRECLMQRSVDEWGKLCDDWVRYDTSYLRRQIGYYVWEVLEYSEDSMDPRFFGLKQPWEMLPIIAQVMHDHLNQDQESLE